jgi:hypothetical protein
VISHCPILGPASQPTDQTICSDKINQEQQIRLHMKLIGAVTSPYVRKVRIVMAEKKLEYQFELEDVWAPGSTIVEFNPLGKVPCLLMVKSIILR